MGPLRRAAQGRPPALLPQPHPLPPLTDPSTFSWCFRSTLLKRNQWLQNKLVKHYRALCSMSVDWQHHCHLGTQRYRSLGPTEAESRIHKSPSDSRTHAGLRGAAPEQRSTLVRAPPLDFLIYWPAAQSPVFFLSSQVMPVYPRC